MSLDILDLSFLCKNWNPLKNFAPSKNWSSSFFEDLVGGSTSPEEKGGSHYEIMVNLKKAAKQKLKSYEDMYTMSTYTMSDGKK